MMGIPSVRKKSYESLLDEKIDLPLELVNANIVTR